MGGERLTSNFLDSAGSVLGHLTNRCSLCLNSSRTITKLRFTPDANLTLLKQNSRHLHLRHTHSLGGIFHLHRLCQGSPMSFKVPFRSSTKLKLFSPFATSLSSLCSFSPPCGVPISCRSACHETIQFYTRKTYNH